MDSIIAKVLNYLLDGDNSKDLTQKEFVKKMMRCKEMIKYDFLSVSGLTIFPKYKNKHFPLESGQYLNPC